MQAMVDHIRTFWDKERLAEKLKGSTDGPFYRGVLYIKALDHF